VTPQDQSKLAGDILTGLRGASNPTAVDHPGEPPSTQGMTEEARNKTQGAYQSRLEAYADYLSSKPTVALTQAEQKFLWAEWGKYRRGE
jgi:hypothetical protein